MTQTPSAIRDLLLKAKTVLFAAEEVKPSMPVPTGYRHDFRHQTWGHAFHCRLQEDGTLAGFVHTGGSFSRTKGVSLGDEMLWATPYGHAIGLVTAVRHCGDPDDMWDVKLTVVDRVANIQALAKTIAKGPVREEHLQRAEAEALVSGFTIEAS